MDALDVLRRSGGVEAIANQLGISPAKAAAGAEALLPAIVGGFQKQSDAAGGGEDGLGSLIGMLGGLGGGNLAANVLSPGETNVAKGNEVLGQIFGSKAVSRTVAGHASESSGIDADTLKKMLPILAMLVGGYLSAKAGGAGAEAGGTGGGLGSLIGALTGGGQGAGTGGLGSLIDLNHDGNPLDDILGMAGKLMR